MRFFQTALISLVMTVGSICVPAIADPIWTANASGGGCDGPTQLGPVVKKTVTVSVAASTAATQIIALAAGAFIHICHVDVTGQTSTGANINLQGGAGTNCATGNFTFWSMALGTQYNPLALGDGSHGLFDVVNASGVGSGMALCYSSGSYVSVDIPQINITYAQY